MPCCIQISTQQDDSLESSTKLFVPQRLRGLRKEFALNLQHINSVQIQANNESLKLQKMQAI